MTHLYEELAKRRALVDQVKKLQSEVDQLDSTKTVPENAIFSSSSKSVCSPINTGTFTKSTTQYGKTVTTPSLASSSSAISYGNHSQRPIGSLASGSSSSPGIISKPSTVMSGPSGTLTKSQSHPLHCSTQPQTVNRYQPCLVQSVGGVPVQMVSYINKDGRVITATAPKTKPTSQKGNAKKKPRVTSQTKPEVSRALPSSPALLSPQTVSTVVFPSTPTGSLRQSPSVSRPHQPLITSPVTPVNTSARPRSELQSTVSLVTSPVTPTPVRQVSAMTTSLPASGSDVPPMVSFVQNGLSYISPLSPLSTMSGAASSRQPTSRATPLSSLSASTEKYLNTFATQMASTPRPSFSTASQSPSVSTYPYMGRTPFPNTDLSTDHSAGIKLLCDLLNDTLPEQPPPLVATSLAVRSLGTPSSLASASPDTSRAEQRRHVDTPPTPPSRSASKSPRTPPMGNTTASPVPGGVTSSVEQTSSAQRTTPTRSATPPTNKKRTSPFTIDNLVRPETQTGRRSKSPEEIVVDNRQPSPASTNRSSPKARNKSPSTNFSIAHITRDMNSPNPTSKTRVPFVTSPGTYSLPVSSGEVNQYQRRISPPAPRLSSPETGQGSHVESSGTSSSNMPQSSTGAGRGGRVPVPVVTVPDSHCVATAGTHTEMEPRQHAPVTRVSSSAPPEKMCHVKSSVVLDKVSRTVPLQTDGPVSALKEGLVDPQRTNPHIGHRFADKDSCIKEIPTTSRTSVVSKDEIVSNEVTSSLSSVNKISSSVSPERGRVVSPAENPSTTIIPDIPLDAIPLPSGKKPSPKNRTSPGKRKRCSPVSQVPKSASPDSEVSSLMANETLPQSPSISSSVSKAGSAVLEGQTPVLVDSNPCSARSPIPVASSLMLQSHAGVSLPSFGSVFSLPKEGEPVASEKSTVKNR